MQPKRLHGHGMEFRKTFWGGVEGNRLSMQQIKTIKWGPGVARRARGGLERALQRLGKRLGVKLPTTVGDGTVGPLRQTRSVLTLADPKACAVNGGSIAQSRKLNCGRAVLEVPCQLMRRVVQAGTNRAW